ncbi:hypothetical protein ScPMuIL_001184 [Solemya velum]
MYPTQRTLEYGTVVVTMAQYHYWTGERPTSTGVMLQDPFRAGSDTVPAPPPFQFRSKTELNYKTSNRFSEHDNRNSFQNHGVYFGDGQEGRALGKQLIDPNSRLHHTDRDFLKHFGKKNVEFAGDSTYSLSYMGESQPRLSHQYRRRFPKAYRQPPTEDVKIDTSTTNWYRHTDVPRRTPMHVLAMSQEPFLKHNAWRYSYHGLKSIYPPYNRTNEPVVDNTFNRYGAAFTSGSNG